MSFSSLPFDTTWFTMIFRTPAQEDLQIFIKPFKYGVWAALAGSMVLVSACMWLFQKISPEKCSLQGPGGAIWSAIGGLFGQGENDLGNLLCFIIK